jgi:hypothetical protein
MADYTTIDNPAKHFNTLLFTGDGTSSRGITGVGFQPDWLWLKTRSKTNSHILIDVVRGANRLRSESQAAEASVSGEFISFDTDGFTLTENSSNEMNNNSTTYVTWNWLGANGTASNSNGSITSTVSANQTAGFSIVTYTGNGTAGATVGHGLGSVPKMIIVKVRNTTNTWVVYHTSLGATKFIEMDSTGAVQTNSTRFNDTEPTSSVFSLGSAAGVNANGNTHVAYCFAEKQGYSKFGKWTGNGQSSGPFIYTGFRPAFLFWKKSSSTENWYINDNKREPFNDDAMSVLYPNLTNSEGALNDEIDLLANGFKINGTNSAHNTDGATYIYWAFAEHPFVTAGTKAAGTAR